MKIVQSFWTKPNNKKKNLKEWDRSSGGWADKRYNYMSWALSCLQFRKHYDEVELVTDEKGVELLIDKLNLPYTSVKVVLDKLNTYHPDLWALGKLYAYRIQEKPFIHVDGDVYIWGKFPLWLCEAELISQNRESDDVNYILPFRTIEKEFKFVPNVLLDFKQKHGTLSAANAGIFGGSNLAFFKSYTDKAFEFVDKNYDVLNSLGEVGTFNMIFEQALFLAMAEKQNIPITYLMEDVNGYGDGLVGFTGIPEQTKYIHTIGTFKKKKYIGWHLENRLYLDHPEYYYRIISLLKSYQI